MDHGATTLTVGMSTMGVPEDPQDPSGGGGFYGGDNDTGVRGISAYPTFYDQISAEANFISSINTDNFPDCFKDVLDDIMALSTNGNVTRMIYKFSQTIPGYKWKLQSGAISSTKVNAFTSKTRLTNTVTTTFDVGKYVNGSDLGIARLILHEADLFTVFPTILTKVRISSIIKKMPCHSGESQNLPSLNLMTLNVNHLFPTIFKLFIFRMKLH